MSSIVNIFKIHKEHSNKIKNIVFNYKHVELTLLLEKKNSYFNSFYNY